MTQNRPHFLVSNLLREAGFRHAFFTRTGGASMGPFASLNFSFTVGDEPRAVCTNLRLAAEALGVPADQMHYLSQVHGRHVVTLSGTESCEQVREIEGDALVSAPRNCACAVRVADCVPILLADSRSRVVAAVHAGWRGVAGNIVGAALRAMQQVGARPAQVMAAIGPHISVAAFEVGEDVSEALAEVAGTDEVVTRAPGTRPHVNLQRIVRIQLAAAGVGSSQVELVGGCTYSDAAQFFSYRRDGQRGGRHLAAIVGAP